MGARPVRWPLRDQVSASSSSASVPMVPGTRTPAAVVSLTPMCRLLLPGFRSSRWAKSASFGSAEATVAHRRPPSPPASPACPPSPPRVGGTPQVRAPVCRAPGPLSLYHLASAQPISPPPMSLWGKYSFDYFGYFYRCPTTVLHFPRRGECKTVVGHRSKRLLGREVAWSPPAVFAFFALTLLEPPRS